MKAPSYSALDLRRIILDAGGSPPAVKPIVDVGRLINRGEADRAALQPVCDALYGKGVIDADELVLGAQPTAEFEHEVDGTLVSVALLEHAGLLARNVRWTYPDGYIASGVSGSHDCAGVARPWRIECAVEASGGRWTDTHIIADPDAPEPPAKKPAAKKPAKKPAKKAAKK